MAATKPKPTSVFVLPSGRTMGYAIYGSTSPSDPAVFYHHGFPGSQGEALGYDSAARQQGIRLVSVERPGMGASTFQPNRTLLDWPADLLALADHLAIARFAVVGVSGGGPYALACWHRLARDRCVGAALVCAMYPTGLGCAGMALETRLLVTLCPWVPGLCGWVLDAMLGAVARDLAHPEKLELALLDVLKKKPAHDRAMLERDDVRTALVAGTRGAMISGGWGSAWDGCVLGGDWGFQLDQVQADAPGRLIMWHGGRDQNVPVAMAEKAAALMPTAELRLSPEAAHIDLAFEKADEVIHSMKMLLGP